MKTYEPSSYWKLLGENCSNNLEKHGYENFKVTVGVLYNNYCVRYNQKTNGMTIDLEEYKKSLRKFWDYMYKNFPSNFLELFDEPKIGNPICISYNGKIVSFDLAASLIEYIVLYSKLNRLESIKTIHEIGGGYGRLGYVIAQLHQDIVYRMYDIEPSISLAKRYLNDCFNTHKFEFHTPDKLEDKCDLLIAMDCLHEMDEEQVENYFDYADKNVKYFYFTCWENTDVKEHGIKWDRQSYPIRKHWKPLCVGKHRMRENFFEALYQCQE